MLKLLIPDGSDGLAREGWVKKAANQGDPVFLDHDRAKPRDNSRPVWEKLLGKSPIMAISLSWTAIVSKPATTAGGWEKSQRKPPIMAISLFSTAIAPNPSASLGKILAKSANHGHDAFFGRDLAKTRDNRDRLGKIPRKLPIMAVWLISDRDRAKAGATLGGQLGKNFSEAAIDGDPALIGPPSCQSQHDAQSIGKNSCGNRQSWPFRENESTGSANLGGWRSWRRESRVQRGGSSLERLNL